MQYFIVVCINLYIIQRSLIHSRKYYLHLVKYFHTSYVYDLNHRYILRDSNDSQCYFPISSSSPLFLTYYCLRWPIIAAGG